MNYDFVYQACVVATLAALAYNQPHGMVPFLKVSIPFRLFSKHYRGIFVDLVLCVLLGHQNSKIANSMKLVNFALFSSQYHVFELKNIRGNLIAPNSNRWSLSNKIAMSQEDNRKIISLFGQEKSIFLHP